ncbi:hypothetical protein SMICM17S_03785 [Streptomyces microflavus]
MTVRRNVTPWASAALVLTALLTTICTSEEADAGYPCAAARHSARVRRGERRRPPSSSPDSS